LASRRFFCRDRPEKDARLVALFDIYKRGQGRYARTITFVAVILIGLGGAAALSGKLGGYALTQAPLISYGVPAVFVFVLGLLIFWLVNRPKSADFLIATEGEMKKVSWSSKKEIIGSTKVVIVATFIMAAILFAVDILFATLFRMLGVTGGSGPQG
jgi:preprotein translocase subunit SecE